jgi:hypothetical protein
VADNTLEIVRNKEALWEAQFARGGEIPKPLAGTWTRRAKLELAIEAYLKERDRPKRAYKKSGRGTKNAENTDTAS